MNFLQLYFVNRDHPVRISLNEDSFKLINEKFLAAPDEPIGFVELETFQGQHVWINADRVIVARYLYEPIEREKLDKKPSQQYPENDLEIPYDDILWFTRFWIEGIRVPLEIHALDGSDWGEITADLDSPRQFITFTDGDDEDVTIRVSKIDFVCGSE